MSVRPAAVADLFYPADARALASFVSTALQQAALHLPAALAAPQAMIVPHAGYIYSGQTAAYAYAALSGTTFRRVILLGPAHRLAFEGMAVPSVDAFASPLGEVVLDRAGILRALSMDCVQCNDAAHAQEHSLEVQLPFLQSVLDEFTLLPICIGAVSSQTVADVIDALLGTEGDAAETLLLISSDLSHFHSCQAAVAMDRQSIETVLAGGRLDHAQACGATGINAAMQLMVRRGWSAQLLDYRNSGDTAGDRQRVVGYAAIGLYAGVEL